jgi:hypothetical protein
MSSQAARSKPCRLRAEEEVAGDAHERHDREVLEDGGDSPVQGIAWRGELERLAVHQQRAGVGLVNAREQLDEGGLAGAVVAQEAVDLAGAHAQRDVLQGDHATEVLRDAARLEDGRCRVAHLRASDARRRR